MSNFPHSTSNSFSISGSPYAIQSNLENLITKARVHPHARRSSVPESPTFQDSNLPSSSSDHNRSASEIPSYRRQSGYYRDERISPIREASYDDGAAILLDEDSNDNDDEDKFSKHGAGGSERASLISKKDKQERRANRDSRDSRGSRRRSYGATTSEPVGRNSMSEARRKSTGSGSVASRSKGNSRSRSKARSPPRRSPFMRQSMKMTENSSSDDEAESRRGRATESRPLSPISTRTRLSDTTSLVQHRRRLSNTATVRWGDDSSGDEGGDVARGLLGTGGGNMLGRSGMGMNPSTAGPGPNGTGAVGLGLEFDPVEELDAEDLQLPKGQNGKEGREWVQALKVEIPILLKSSVPVFLTQMAEWSLVLSSVVSIGHVGTTELAACSLASMTASVSSFSILQGLVTSLDTLLPAAWTSSDPSRVGLWTQRQAVVIAVSMIPMFILWWNVEGILVALGQDRQVAATAARYLKYLSFGIPGYGGNCVIKKYLQAQNLMHVPTLVLFVAAPVNLLLNYLLVWGPDAVRLGFVGGAVATAASYNLAFLLSLGWALFYGPREAFHPLKFKHVFSKLGTVTSLGLAGTIMLSSEWWAWEACALAASLLGPVPLAAQSVLLSTASTFYQVPAALGIASAVRCGNLLGAGRAWEAKWASRASLFLSVIFAVINSVILVLARNSWGYLFNSDPDVVWRVAEVLPFIALFQLTDGIAATAGAILRSQGLHTTGALINLTCYYIIGLPSGLWLTFAPQANLGLTGIWLGLSFALGYASVVGAMLVWIADWPRAVERVRERLGLGTLGEIGDDGKWEEEGNGNGHAEYVNGDEDTNGGEMREAEAERQPLIKGKNFP